jgi:thioredoxin-related protein
MAPIVHGLEAEYYGRIGFAYLDASDPATRTFQQQLGFRVQPEFYLLDGQGNVVKKWFGYVRAEDFRAAFDQILGQ